MIYLILTASLHNRVLSSLSEDRYARYRYAISETLRHVPCGIQPLIVENTGRGTLLTGFTCQGEAVPVIHTENGALLFRNKGVNEWLDIQTVMDTIGMKDEDIVVKLSGRYRLLSSRLFEDIEKEKGEREAWFRFLNVSTKEKDPNDCVLGCYGAKVGLLRLLSWTRLNGSDSPERAMARFLRSTVIPSHRLAEKEVLDVECVFSEDGRVLCV